MQIRKKLGAVAIELTVFCSGALIMVYEIIGSRILSPYVGTSTYTWTSLIGVILASLSLGYWIGGNRADRNPGIRTLAGALFLAGAMVSLTVLTKDALLTIISQSALILEFKTVIAATLLFAPASVMLGFVAPYAVKLRTTSLEDTGKTVGRLYALSTVGSILGTFAAGFLMIPFIGSTRTLYSIAAVLFALAALLAPIAVTRTNVVVFLLFAAGIGLTETRTVILRNSFAFYDFDTEYSRVRIFDTTQRGTGKRIRAMAIDPYIYQSSMYVESGEPATRYHRFYHLAGHFNPQFEHVLMIGGAGYSFPKEYLKRYRKRTMDVVEIDPQMTALARRFFRLSDDPRLRIFHEDGRLYLNRAANASYDAVLLDAFTSLFSVPYHLTTIEAVREMHRVLSDDGVVILNIGSATSGDAGLFLEAEISTYQNIFEEVILFKVKKDAGKEKVQNIILVALKKKSNRPPSPDPEILSLLGHRFVPEDFPKAAALTDDLAPVEYYNSFSQRKFASDADSGG